MTDRPAGGTLRIAAVVVTWNRLGQLQTTLARLLAAPLDHVVVVDNASTDGTREWLAAQRDARLVVLTPPANLGGAGGFALGMRHAAETFDPDWMLVSDDDGRPEPGTIAQFRQRAAAGGLDGWDAVATAVRSPAGVICDMNRPVLNPFAHGDVFWRTALGGGRAAFHLSDADFGRTAPMRVDATSFVGLFLSRAALQRAGYPDADLFLYGDDGIYTLDLTRQGGRIGFFPDLRFEHDLSTFTGADRRFRPMWKVYYYHRNLLFLYRRAAGWFFWPALMLVVLPKWLLKARDHRGHQRVFLHLMRLAVQDGLTGRTSRSHAEVMALAAGA